MTFTEKSAGPHLRLWPGVAAVTIQWLAWFGLGAVVPDAAVAGVLGGVACGVIVLIWWAFFSRVPHFERWGALLFIIAAVAASPLILHPSIVGGMMGMMFRIYVIPGLCLALVLWALASRFLGPLARRAALAAAILIACGAWALARTDGITGEGHSQFAWRWKPTHEQVLLARAEPVIPAAVPASLPAPPKEKTPEPVSPPAVQPAVLKIPARPHAASPVEWPGFRGPHRDDIVTGIRIQTDWTASPPVQLWRRPVGPGWSSFAVGGGLIYTQEQRGDSEIVSCYNQRTGKPVWTHGDAARFWESNAGAGPRGTPALHDGYVYTFGATGILNALDASNGAVMWTRNAASDTGAQLPGWGFASSPLVVDQLVVVAASGRLAAYDRTTGEPRWRIQEGGASYSSPHLATIDGVPQILLLNAVGAISVEPASGRMLWKHPWPGAAMLQPVVTADSGVLITSGDMSGGMGTRRLAIAHAPGGWTANEVWTSPGLKPYFNDIVVHNGHAFGFDGGILACIDLQDGKRKWKGGRYGHGQLLLLADQDLLLVLSEEGELALVGAVPGQFTEIARFPAIEGKTWNHPAMAGDTLLVRNGQEMVAFRLPVAGI